MGWKTLYVFISSTFNDMHAERDLLVKRVFPDLKVHFAEYKINIVDIDLRWGISRDEALKNNNVVGKCLENIDKARPLFIGLLGQRYGWQPGEEFLRNSYEQFPGLKEMSHIGYSVTEHEINHALFSEYHIQHKLEQFGPIKKALFYKRNDDYLQHFQANAPHDLKRIYSDSYEQDSQIHQQLVEKLHTLEKKIASNHDIKNYSCSWDKRLKTPELALPMVPYGETLDDIQEWKNVWKTSAGFTPEGNCITEGSSDYQLASDYNKLLCSQRLSNFKCEGKELAKVIFDDLVGVIEEELKPVKPDYANEGEKSKAQQEKNLYDIVQNSVFTENDTQELSKYVNDETDSFCMLTAKPGAGKTTFIASWIKAFRTEDTNTQLIYRFIGADDYTIDIITLLRSILKEASGKLESDIQYLTDEEVLLDWANWMISLSNKNMVVVIDGVDQLEQQTTLSWVPEKLPEGLKLILSVKNSGEEEHLINNLKSTNKVIKLNPLSDDNKRYIINSYLGQYLKSLDNNQINEVLSFEGVKAHGAPLYLQVLLSELRVFGSFFQLQQYIKQKWGPTPQSAFKNKLQRMVTDRFYSPLPLKESVPVVMQLLANARRGLSIVELAEGMYLHVSKNSLGDLNRSQCSDSVLLVINQMRPFINHRNGRYFFFYQSLKQAVNELWLTHESLKYWHSILGVVFDTGNEYRRLSELPFHLIVSANQYLFLQKICTHNFVEQKLKLGLFTELVADFRDAALIFSDSPIVNSFHNFLRKHYAVLANYPQAFAQMALNESSESYVFKSISREKLLVSYNWLNKADYLHSIIYSFPTLKNQNGIGFNNSDLLAVSTYENKLMVFNYLNGKVLQNKQLEQLYLSKPKFGNNVLFTYSAKLNSILSYNLNPFQLIKSIPLSTQLSDFELSDCGNIMAVIYGIQAEILNSEGKSQMIINHNSVINQLAFSHNCSLVATASSDKILRVSSVNDQSIKWLSRKHFDEVHSVCFSNNDAYLISGSIDELIVWDIEAKLLLKRFNLPFGIISSIVSFDLENDLGIIAASISGHLAYMSLNKGILGSLNLKKGAITYLQLKNEQQLIVINEDSEAFLVDISSINGISQDNNAWQVWSCAAQSNETSGEISATFGNSNGELTIYDGKNNTYLSKETIDVFDDQIMDIVYVEDEFRIKIISGNGYLLDSFKTYSNNYKAWQVHDSSQVAKGSLLSVLHIKGEYEYDSYTYISDFKGNINSVEVTDSGEARLTSLYSLKPENVIGLFALDMFSKVLANTGEALYLVDLSNSKHLNVVLDPETLNRFEIHNNLIYSLTKRGKLKRINLKGFENGVVDEKQLVFDLETDRIADFCLNHLNNQLIFITGKGLLVFYDLDKNEVVNISKLSMGLKSVAVCKNKKVLAIAGSAGFKAVALL